MATQTAPRTTAQIAQNGALTPSAKALIHEQPIPARFVQSLLERHLYADALHFLCRWLPPREGTWWGCLCLWHTARPNLADRAVPAFQATVRWVQSPTAQRLQNVVAAAAQADDLDHPAGHLAEAAACPDPTRASNILLSVLLLAAARHGPLDPAPTQREFVELGLEIAEGKTPWA